MFISKIICYEVSLIQNERLKVLNTHGIKNRRYILYWMQASHRAEYNHALEYSILKANELHRPVLVYFGITENYPDASERHYHFMLEGLKEVKSSLEDRGIKMVVRHGSPEIGVVELSKSASLVVFDRGYLRIHRNWRDYAAKHIDCRLIQVESDVVVPVEEASPKEEYAAATLRPKMKTKLNDYLVVLRQNRPRLGSLDLDIESFDISDPRKAISRLNIDRSVKIAHEFRGGAQEAKKHLDDFLKNKLDEYAKVRNDPTKDVLSNMSPYLHFGQISPLYIALRVSRTDSPGRDAYLEELIVRRELAINFVSYNRNYDSFEGLPEWAKTTLRKHKKDPRQYLYRREELEEAKTHDSYWNAAQEEMRRKGKMHGYMRMYWGKKILEWTKSPEQAFRTALALNNRYELDGRDPNGFAGVAWCFGKHDRPWKERQIFGKVRYMTGQGLKRKFDVDLYAEVWSRRAEHNL